MRRHADEAIARVTREPRARPPAIEKGSKNKALAGGGGAQQVVILSIPYSRATPLWLKIANSIIAPRSGRSLTSGEPICWQVARCADAARAMLVLTD